MSYFSRRKKEMFTYLATSTQFMGNYAVKFSSTDDEFTLTTSNSLANWNGTMEYSTDGYEWQVWTGSSISSVNQVLYIRGTNNTVVSKDNGTFVLTGSNITASNSFEYLLDYIKVRKGIRPTMDVSCFYDLFINNTALVSVSKDILPMNNLPMNAYISMFEGCTNLKSVPDLPAMVLGDSCYNKMFKGCTSLTEVPNLPAMNLTIYCYQQMFEGCTGLVNLPEDLLPATNLPKRCYANMFARCTNLETIPYIHGTHLGDYCCQEMFSYCKYLILKESQSDLFPTRYSIPIEGTSPTTGELPLVDMFFGTGGVGTPHPILNYYLYKKPQALTFVAQSENSTVLYGVKGTVDTSGIQCKLNDDEWASWEVGVTVLMGVGDSLQIRNTKNTWSTGDSNYITVSTNGSFEVQGRVDSLINYSLTLPSDYCFCNLFKSSRVLTLNDKLLATYNDLTENCYSYMFSNCIITKIPENFLPATNLAKGCYSAMFGGCSLTIPTLPSNLLPATTLADSCYESMFSSCGVTEIPEDFLPATTLADRCYESMFYMCTGLISVNCVLPASELPNKCYYGMFSGCTSLININDNILSNAKVLVEDACVNMFRNTHITNTGGFHPTNLGEASCDHMFAYSEIEEIPIDMLADVTNIESDCCIYMFVGCKNITQPINLKMTELPDGCYGGMFVNCSNIKLNTVETGNYTKPYRIPSEGVITSVGTGSLDDMFAGTGGVFSGTPTENTTYYLWEDPEAFKISSKSGEFTIATANSQKNWDGTLESSTDGLTWGVWDGTTTLSSNSKVLYLRGTNNTVISGASDKGFVISGSNIVLSNNIDNLLDYNTVVGGGHPTMGNNCYQGLFKGNTNIIKLASNLFSALTVSSYAYANMFEDCTGITTLVNGLIPTTTVADYCNSYMFRGCTGLTSLPDNLMVAEDLHSSTNCYQYMFEDCTNLKYLPSTLLKATTLGAGCYNAMFKGCNNIISIPTGFLPATTLSDTCYKEMFCQCGRLTSLPNKLITATTLGINCCNMMFWGCTGLTEIPDDLLYTTDSKLGCFQQMFEGCKNLVNAPEINILLFATRCCFMMFKDCVKLSRLHPFYESTLCSGTDACNLMFLNCSSLYFSNKQDEEYTGAFIIPQAIGGTTNFTNMFQGTSGTFTGTPTQGATYYTKNLKSVTQV